MTINFSKDYAMGDFLNAKEFEVKSNQKMIW